MKRRHFGLLSSVSMVAAAARPSLAQTATPDPSLLTTTLTPMGAERAGNADGSIPPWTGGMVSPPLPPGTPVDVEVFTDEQPLYTVDASNLAQYQNLVTPGMQAQIQKFGLSMKVYPTHRTSAAPQYIYDNAAKNVTRAQFSPEGGRFGFTGAYGGPPFPIISSDPDVAGPQLIWNHLLAWPGYAENTLFASGFVVVNGKPLLTFGGHGHFICPYYDPNGSPETYDGYFSKLIEFYLAPPASNGQEILAWHSSNVSLKPDIVWTLLTGQGRVRKTPNEAYDTPDPVANGINNDDDSGCFYGNPHQYDWKMIGKQEYLTPYNCNAIHFRPTTELLGPQFPNPDIIRWEKHRMWVVEANLHPGERNTTVRRRIYIDEDSWYGTMTEMWDANGTMIKTGTLYPRVVPSLPGVINVGEVTWDMQTGNYVIVGNMDVPGFNGSEFLTPQNPSYFEAQEMAANASF